MCQPDAASFTLPACQQLLRLRPYAAAPGTCGYKRVIFPLAALPPKNTPQEPLLLYACGYEGLSFIRTHAATDGAQADVTGLLHRHLVGAALTGACQARIASNPRWAGRQGWVSVKTLGCMKNAWWGQARIASNQG